MSHLAAQTVSSGQSIKVAAATILGVTTITAVTVVAIHSTSRHSTPASSRARAVASHAEPLGLTPVMTLGTSTGRKPVDIDFSADGGQVVRHIHWASWTDTGATGHGTTRNMHPGLCRRKVNPIPGNNPAIRSRQVSPIGDCSWRMGTRS